jgi:hypothetical protein
MRPAWRSASCSIVALHAAGATASAAADTAPLRVCAKPNNLPSSHRDGSGFENRIARLVAQELERPLEFVWHPQWRAFTRKTLGAGKCDLRDRLDAFIAQRRAQIDAVLADYAVPRLDPVAQPAPDIAQQHSAQNGEQAQGSSSR